jgi:hypothetical protein
MCRIFLRAAAVVFVGGCAHPFTLIQPGMNATEVRGTTGSVAPTNVIPYSNGGQAWFYGSERCVLLVDDKVVAKYSADTAPPGAKAETVCVPPGVAAAPQGATTE